MRERIIANNKKHLKSLISEQIKLYGTECDLNHIDISKVIDLSFLFHNSNCEFNGDISKWDMSSATNVNYLFYNSKFNGDISLWNVSSVMNMSYLFEDSKFTGDISNWNTSNATDMSNLFAESKFNKNISAWDVSNVTDMSYLFYNSQFKGDLYSWKPLNVEKNGEMYLNCKAPVPYWFGDNNEEIVKKIESYDLFNKISSELNDKEIKTKQMKI